MMRRLLLIALLLSPVSAWAQALFGTNAPPTAPITATGGATGRTPMDRAADVLNVKDGSGTTPGAKGDGKCANGGQCTLSSTTSMTASSTTLTVGTALFSPSDVGKVLILANAGASPTTGSVTTIPVATQGSGYTSLPTCSVSTPSTGSGATCSTQATVISATVATGGAGCAGSGTQTFTVVSGVGRWATITGTVTGGVLGGSLTVVDGGYYSTLPTLSGAFLSGGGGCTTYPSVNLSMGIKTVAMTAWGTGYPMSGVTASLSGGSPGVAATLGTPTVYAPIPPLVATISGYTSPTQVTTTAAAQTTISGSVPLFWATDDYAAIQAVLTAGNAQGKNVYIPSGDYFTSAALDPGSGNISIRGDGQFASRLWFNAFASQAFFNTHGSPTAIKGSLQFEDFAIRGLLDFGMVGADTGNDAITLQNYSELNFSRMHFYYTPNGVMSNEAIRNFTAENNLVEYIDSVSLRCRSCFNGIYVGNHFFHTDDDSVDFHQANYIQAAGTIRRGLTVVGNTFEDAIAIHSLGARQITISNNTCMRCKMYMVDVDSTTHEGVNPIYGIDIHDNVATDTLGRAPFNGTGTAISQGVFIVGAIPPQAGANDPNMIPGSMFRASTTIVPPYSYYDNSQVNTNDSTVYPLPPAVGVNVHDNHVFRTLPATEQYSNWGFGTPISELLGLGQNPPVTDVGLRPVSGISLSFNGLGNAAHNNTVMNVQRGITVSGTAVSPALSMVSLTENFIYDAVEYGIYINGMSLENRVSISGGRIVSDPFRLSAGRAATAGTWSNGFSDNLCIAATGGVAVRVSNVAFEECYQPEGGGATQFQNLDNWIYAGVNTLGAWASLNTGIGVPPFGGAGYHLLPVGLGQSAPTSYGASSTTHVLEAATAPTSGQHYQGEVIRSTNPSGCTCYGWSILTTGTTWTSGTDYQPISLP